MLLCFILKYGTPDLKEAAKGDSYEFSMPTLCLVPVVGVRHARYMWFAPCNHARQAYEKERQGMFLNTE